jgi:hypothetical protein
VIDLEDRWFDTRWQEMGKENRVEEVQTVRWQTKPLERRALFVPTSNNPQVRMCCLELMHMQFQASLTKSVKTLSCLSLCEWGRAFGKRTRTLPSHACVSLDACISKVRYTLQFPKFIWRSAGYLGVLGGHHEYWRSVCVPTG